MTDPRAPAHLSIHAAAAEAPATVGLIHGDTAYSFAELAARTSGVQRAWERYGAAHAGDVAPAAPCFVVAEPDLGTALTVYATFASGATCVLLHHRATAAERAAQLALCHELDPAPAPGREARIVLFTSGSTGRSKGVVLPGAAFVASAAASAANLGWREDDRWLCCLPLAHVGGLSILARCLMARRTAVLDSGAWPGAPPGASFDPARVARIIERERVTLASLVPTMLVRLLDAGWTPPAHLRAVLLGGAAATPALLTRAAERGVPVLLTYGMTETCSQVCTQPHGAPARAGVVGAPLPGVELRVRDGHIQVRGPMLMERYLGAPTPMDERGWLDTGDRGVIEDDGMLRVLGRAGDTIITGGENVHPGEIEPVIAAHPALAAACVFGIDDPTWGQIVAAAVVPRGDLPAAALAADLARFLAPRLPAHKRPRRLAVLPSLPTGATGKTDRAAAARLAATHLIPVRYSGHPSRID